LKRNERADGQYTIHHERATDTKDERCRNTANHRRQHDKPLHNELYPTLRILNLGLISSPLSEKVLFIPTGFQRLDGLHTPCSFPCSRSSRSLIAPRRRPASRTAMIFTAVNPTVIIVSCTL